MRKHLPSIGVLCLLFQLFSSLLSASTPSTSSENNLAADVENLFLACFAQVNISLPSSGMIEILPSMILDASSDLSSADTVYVTPRFFSCSDIGSHIVTVTAQAGSIVNSCFSTVVIEDKIAPTIACESNVNVSLNDMGVATITAEMLLAGSSDNCDLSFSLSQSSFDCNDVGNTYLITITATDPGGNTAQCFSNVTIEDKSVPLLSCVGNLNVSLDFNGLATLIPESLVLAAVDNCAINLSVSPSNFDCSDIDISHPVTVTATDVAGNFSQCISNVLIEDKLSPIAICNASIQVDLAGNPSVSITVNDVDSGSFDNCSVMNRSLSQTSFTSADLGINVVILTVEDQSGNSNTCTVNVEVIDSSSGYCAASGNNTSFEYIQRVKLRQINNISGDNGGYADFTSLQARLKRGKNNKLVLKPGFPSGSYPEYWKVWIDWNQDEDFDDAGEEIFSGLSIGKIVHFFDTPTSATLGITRMRVAMRFGAPPNSCGSFTYGEVEDYRIKVVAGPSARLANSTQLESKELNFQLFPNPAKDHCFIEIDAPEQVQFVRVYNLVGQQFLQISGNQLDQKHRLELGKLPEGIYIVQVKTRDQSLTKKLYHQP